MHGNLRRRRGAKAASRSLGLALGASLLLSGALLAAGCETAPGRAIRGARHYAAGSDALALGETERAVVELERAAILVPHASEIQNHLGLAYRAAGRSDEARRAFEAAIQLDCDNAAARQNLESLDRADPSRHSLGQEAQVGRPGEADGG